MNNNKFFTIILAIFIAVGLTSCTKYKQPLVDQNGDPTYYAPGPGYHKDPLDKTGEKSFQVGSYEVGEIDQKSPFSKYTEINTRKSGWNRKCAIHVVVTSSNSYWITDPWDTRNQIMCQDVSAYLVYNVEKAGLVSFQEREHAFAPPSGEQRVYFSSHKEGDKTHITFATRSFLKFFLDEVEDIDFSVYDGVYLTEGATSTYDGIVWEVLKIKKQVDSPTEFDRSFAMECWWHKPQ